MEAWICLFVIVFVLIAAVVAQANTIKKNQDDIASKLKDIPNFTPTKTLVTPDALGCLAIDDTSRQFCIVTKAGQTLGHKVFPYKDMIASEMFEDGQTLTKTSRSSQVAGALVGGIVLGGAGLLLGGLSGKKRSVDEITRIDLRVIVSDIHHPEYVFNFLNVKSKKNSALYTTARNNARQWYSVIEVVIKQADAEASKLDKQEIVTIVTPPAVNSIADELEKLAGLRDKGILSLAEFDAQKRSLLGTDTKALDASIVAELPVISKPIAQIASISTVVQLDPQTLTEQGIAAVKSGDLQTARRLLTNATDQDPKNQAAWLWLSGAVNTDQEKQYCLEQVLSINPHTDLGKMATFGLQKLQQSTLV
jgi:hypothetical protein